MYVLIEFNYFAGWNSRGLLRPVFIVLRFHHRLVSSGKLNLIIFENKAAREQYRTLHYTFKRQVELTTMNLEDKHFE